MSKLTIISDRALELAEQAGAGLRHAGSSLRDAGIGAEQWIKTGAALGAAKAGFKVARGTVRRHPVAVATAAAVVGAGVLAYVLYRKRRQQQAQEPIEGESRRMPRSNGNASARARQPPPPAVVDLGVDLIHPAPGTVSSSDGANPAPSSVPAAQGYTGQRHR